MTQAVVPARNTRAILMMIAAIFCFSVMDMSVKGLAPRVGVLPALWVRYAGQMLLVLVLVAPRLRSVARTEHLGMQLLRSVLIMMATAFFFLGISLIPLTDASALMATNPVLITLGAALFLGERLGPRRIAGIAVAVTGALVIIRPGSDVFSPAALLPLAAAVSYSSYVLLTRRLGPGEDAWTSLFYTGAVGAVVLTLVIPFVWQRPDAIALGLMGLIAVFGTVGQLALIRAFSEGEAAMLAPFAYLNLVFAGFWGMTLYGEVPDLWTVAGTLVIAGAGLYVWYRETYRVT
ncbi:DMT family transporter [Albibacillus kandeliae]|uniref:DMT family transporter n=1 Tax=Albibacillus kandeliae TaxID=2174228 RepID=UPI000D69F7EB|nr:DMT family transporter [Albibacillus kandeliae]